MSLSGPAGPDRICCVLSYHHSQGSTRRAQREIEGLRQAVCAVPARVQRPRPALVRGWITSASGVTSRSITCRATSARSRL